MITFTSVKDVSRMELIRIKSCPSGNAALTLRSRLRCIVMKKESQDSQVTKPATNLLVLNEVRAFFDPFTLLEQIHPSVRP